MVQPRVCKSGVKIDLISRLPELPIFEKAFAALSQKFDTMDQWDACFSLKRRHGWRCGTALHIPVGRMAKAMAVVPAWHMGNVPFPRAPDEREPRQMNNKAANAHHAPDVAAGAGPFVTFRRFHRHGRIIEWRARHHRKGLDLAARALHHADLPFWQVQAYNWWTGALFAIGSFLFVLGSALSLSPGAVQALSLPVVNSVFFAGSIPFTIAAFLQNFQAANAGDYNAPIPQKIALFGWRPGDPGWLSTFCQFIGTIAFNFNTFDAIHSPPGQVMQNLVIWGPGMIGSVLFLVSAYLAFIETAHSFWTWRTRDLAWKIVFINLVGCVFFMLSSTLFYSPRATWPDWVAQVANASLGLGAVGFLLGAVLLMREARTGA